MTTRPFSSYSRRQATFEIRYPQPFLLWDRSGELWNSTSKIFSSLVMNSAAPNNMTFSAENRYTLAVTHERAFIIDNRADKMTDQLARFIEIVIGTLELKLLDRVGIRLQYAIDCETKKEAADIIAAYKLTSEVNSKLFDVDPVTIVPAFRVEGTDDQLGYLFQFGHRQRKVEFNVSAEIADLDIPSMDREIDQVAVDLDLFTAIPTSTASFSATEWLNKCTRAASRDIPKLLGQA